MHLSPLHSLIRYVPKQAFYHQGTRIPILDYHIIIFLAMETYRKAKDSSSSLINVPSEGIEMLGPSDVKK